MANEPLTFLINLPCGVYSPIVGKLSGLWIVAFSYDRDGYQKVFQIIDRTPEMSDYSSVTAVSVRDSKYKRMPLEVRFLNVVPKTAIGHLDLFNKYLLEHSPIMGLATPYDEDYVGIPGLRKNMSAIGDYMLASPIRYEDYLRSHLTNF